MIVYDKTGIPYRFKVEKQRHGVYYITINDSFYTSAESEREAKDEIEQYIKDNRLSCFYRI